MTLIRPFVHTAACAWGKGRPTAENEAGELRLDPRSGLRIPCVVIDPPSELYIQSPSVAAVRRD